MVDQYIHSSAYDNFKLVDVDGNLRIERQFTRFMKSKF